MACRQQRWRVPYRRMSNSTLSDKVSHDRWQAAQKWEREFWVTSHRLMARHGRNWVWRFLSAFGLAPKYRGDDWNHWWKQQFDAYSFLPPVIPNALEVGCGPYTNVRLMLDRCRFEHLYLSDPLIRSYAEFKLSFVAEMHRAGACVLDDHPLEALLFESNYFDLAVMINVLDHVEDAPRCMDNLIRVIKPGGILILGQDLTNEEDPLPSPQDAGSIGHPIRLDHHWFAPYLDKGFSPIIRKVLPRAQGRGPEHHYGDLIFAGRKL
jgi:ubiquinone/menaquinone biosynthesis C-methylase UbiE